MFYLAAVYVNQGRDDDAEWLILKAADIASHNDLPWKTGALLSLSRLYTRRERYEDAEELLREIVEWQQRKAGASDTRTLGSMVQLGTVILKQGRLEEAEGLLVRVLESSKLAPGPIGVEIHNTTLFTLSRIAALQRRRDESVAWLRRAIDAGYDDLHTLASHPDLASLHGDPEFEAIVADVKRRDGEE
jgi:tetratricopeptide (TPR) repeat protein